MFNTFRWQLSYPRARLSATPQVLEVTGELAGVFGVIKGARLLGEPTVAWT